MFRLLVVSCLLICVYGASINDPFQLDGRIVGGHSISIGNAPYQASYQLLSQHKCGASIISNNFALSAAHCSRSDPALLVTIRVGTDQRGRGGSVHRASQIINHSRYTTTPATDFDISLVRVSAPFVYSATVKPISLASAEPAAGSSVVTSGWGATSEGGSGSNQLLQVQVTVISHAVCNSAYTNRITSTMLCAGEMEGGKDTCQGDSGGPLVSGNQLVGVVSWGAGCARRGFPGVYANVATLRSWIKENSGV